MEALKANKIIGNQNDGRAVFYYFFQIPGNKGFKIACATPNWRIFFLPLVVVIFTTGEKNYREGIKLSCQLNSIAYYEYLYAINNKTDTPNPLPPPAPPRPP